MNSTAQRVPCLMVVLTVACALPPSAVDPAELSEPAPSVDAPKQRNERGEPTRAPSTDVSKLELSPWRGRPTESCPDIEPDLRSLRFGTLEALDCPRRNTCRLNPKLVGASEAEIYAYLGRPQRCLGDAWIFRFNGECGAEHDIVQLDVANGSVEAAQHLHYFAGESSEGCVSASAEG